MHQQQKGAPLTSTSTISADIRAFTLSTSPVCVDVHTLFVFLSNQYVLKLKSSLEHGNCIEIHYR
jgi:hypothetical protein